MDIFTIRQKLRSTRLSDIPLRVTFYARVSTDSDEQLNSLDNQIGYYRDYITRNPAWTFIDGYIDEGLSGMTTRKRDNFQRMVQDAKDDKFDLILTKEITRFAAIHSTASATRASCFPQASAFSSRTTTSTRSTRTRSCASPSCPASRRTSCASCRAASGSATSRR